MHPILPRREKSPSIPRDRGRTNPVLGMHLSKERVHYTLIHDGGVGLNVIVACCGCWTEYGGDGEDVLLVTG